MPKIDINDLKLDLAGIRPRIIIEDNKNPDFYVKEEESGFFNLIGIESPGLTALLLSVSTFAMNLILVRFIIYFYFQIFKYYIYELETNNQNKFVDKISKIKYSIF